MTLKNQIGEQIKVVYSVSLVFISVYVVFEWYDFTVSWLLSVKCFVTSLSLFPAINFMIFVCDKWIRMPTILWISEPRIRNVPNFITFFYEEMTPWNVSKSKMTFHTFSLFKSWSQKVNRYIHTWIRIAYMRSVKHCIWCEHSSRETNIFSSTLLPYSRCV